MVQLSNLTLISWPILFLFLMHGSLGAHCFQLCAASSSWSLSVIECVECNKVRHIMSNFMTWQLVHNVLCMYICLDHFELRPITRLRLENWNYFFRPKSNLCKTKNPLQNVCIIDLCWFCKLTFDLLVPLYCLLLHSWWVHK